MGREWRKLRINSLIIGGTILLLIVILAAIVAPC